MISIQEFFQEKDKLYDNGINYLSDICSTGSLVLVKECIRRRRESSDLSQLEIDKALFTACKRGSITIIEELLNEGGNCISTQSCEKCGEHDDNYTSYPLKIAIEKKRKDVFQLLLEKSKIPEEGKGRYKNYKLYEIACLSLGEIESECECEEENEEEENIIYLETLYEKGYLEKLRRDDINSLFRTSYSSGYLRGVQIFLKLGVDIKKLDEKIFYDSDYPLLIACHEGYEKIAYELLSSGVNLDCIEKIKGPKMKRKMEEYIQKIGNIKPAIRVSKEEEK